MLRAMRRKSHFRLFACVAFLGGAATAQSPPAQMAPEPPATQTQPSQSQSAGPAGPASPAEPAPLQWKTYSFPDDGFSASFPSQPATQKQIVPADSATLELRNYTVETPSLALEVGVCDYGDAIHGSDPDAILAGAKNGAVSNANARLITARKIMLGIYPGIAFEAEVDQLHLSARLYLVGTLLYQTFVSRPADQSNADVNKFLDSFQLIPRPVP